MVNRSCRNEHSDTDRVVKGVGVDERVLFHNFHQAYGIGVLLTLDSLAVQIAVSSAIYPCHSTAELPRPDLRNVSLIPGQQETSAQATA